MSSSAICEIFHINFSIEHFRIAASLEILLGTILLQMLIPCVCKVKKYSQPMYYILSNVLFMKGLEIADNLWKINGTQICGRFSPKAY